MKGKRHAARSKRRPAILVVQQFFYPDVSAVSQLLTGLLTKLSSETGFQFSVLCTSVARLASHSTQERLKNIKIRRIPVPHFRKNPAIVTIAQTAVFHLGVFFYLVLSQRYDAVISLTSPPLVGFTVAMALHLRNRRLLYYIEDLYPELLFDSRVITKPFIVKKLSLFNRITLRRADRTVVIGEYMARKLYHNYGISRAEVQVIPNWASPVDYVRPDRKGRLSIVYSGNLGFAHDLTYIPELLNLLKDVDVEYRFIGAGRRFQEVKRLYQSVGESRVSFNGYLDLSDHSRVLAEATVFLVAQSWRTVGDVVPSKFYSYLLAGRPILFFGPLQSEIGGVIHEYDLGAVVEVAADIEPAVEKLRRYMLDDGYYRDTCDRAHQYYERTFGLSRAVAQFQDILTDLVVPEGRTP